MPNPINTPKSHSNRFLANSTLEQRSHVRACRLTLLGIKTRGPLTVRDVRMTAELCETCAAILASLPAPRKGGKPRLADEPIGSLWVTCYESDRDRIRAYAARLRDEYRARNGRESP